MKNNKNIKSVIEKESKQQNKVKKVAVVLFNLGGPDKPESVEPFLFNLFYDKAIISLINPFRYFLAKFISGRREKEATKIYNQIGGKSPILEETQKQAKKVQKYLNDKNTKVDYKVFIAMRYWHPFTSQVIKQVNNYTPDEVVLLPLYPQFSTTTTRSFIREWLDKEAKNGFNYPTRIICCYPFDDNFLEAHVQLIKDKIKNIKNKENVRLLFSAHGLPQKVVDAGDPYQWQVEQTTNYIINRIGDKDLDWQVCYQSKVGPLKWLEPSTDKAIEYAIEDRKDIVVVPIAFVSEHSETLVELDIEYKELVDKSGVSDYHRIPTLGISKKYIESLGDMVINVGDVGRVCSSTGGRICPREFSKCPSKTVAGINVEAKSAYVKPDPIVS